VAAVMAPGLEVIADEDRLVPEPLGEAGELEQLARSELLGGGLVADSEQGIQLIPWTERGSIS
jgi:hypothetical protein